MNARYTLTRLYAEYLNTCLPVECYAKENNLSVVEATKLLEIARRVYISKPPAQH